MKEYEDKLQSELQLIRQQAEEDVKRNKKEISELFDSKVFEYNQVTIKLIKHFNWKKKLQFQNLENELQRKKKAAESAQEDIDAAYGRINELTQQINGLLSTNTDLVVCITIGKKYQCFYLIVMLYSNGVHLYLLIII